MDSGNRYERAFVAWLQAHRLTYLPVEEGQRRELGTRLVKSPDLIVYDHGGRAFVVDVKGRRFPGGGRDRPRRVWERWCTQADCSSLLAWGQFLGATSLLVFVYHLHTEPKTPLPTTWLDRWSWQQANFALCGIAAELYIQHMRLRSPRWETVSMPSAVFQALAKPVSLLFGLRGENESVSTGSLHCSAR